MMALVERLRSGWTGIKSLRVILGSLILYSSITEGHIAGMVLGGMFTIFSLFTNGVCCGPAGCRITAKKGPAALPEHFEYEELADK